MCVFRFAPAQCRLQLVTVQVVKTGITPPLATSGRFWGAEMERLHHARRLHAQQGGTPRHCAAVASTSPPPSSCLRQSASPPHSASQNCPCATARLDGALSLPCCSSVRRRRPARRSTTPRAASKSPGRSLRSWPPHHESPLLRAAPPRSEVASYRSEKSIASTSPRAPDATMKTSGAPAPARRRQSPRSPRHDLVSLQNPAAHAPSTADATSPGTSCRHCSGRGPACRPTPPPTAHEPPAHRETGAPQTRSQGSSPPPITTPVCRPAASWSRRGGPPLALQRKRGLPLRVALTPVSWPAPTGWPSPHSSAHI